jgi:hypothetical protein
MTPSKSTRAEVVRLLRAGATIAAVVQATGTESVYVRRVLEKLYDRRTAAAEIDRLRASVGYAIATINERIYPDIVAAIGAVQAIQHGIGALRGDATAALRTAEPVVYRREAVELRVPEKKKPRRKR